MKKQITVDVSASAHNVVQALKGVIDSTKKSLADGFQPGSDIPVIVGQNLTNLLTAISEAKNLPAESKEDLEAFLKAWAIGGTEIAALFFQTPAAPAAPSA